jgi:hypothetical protein
MTSSFYNGPNVTLGVCVCCQVLSCLCKKFVSFGTVLQSCIRRCSGNWKYVQTCLGDWKYVQTCLGDWRYVQTCLGDWKYVQTCLGDWKYMQTCKQMSGSWRASQPYFMFCVCNIEFVGSGALCDTIGLFHCIMILHTHNTTFRKLIAFF